MQETPLIFGANPLGEASKLRYPELTQQLPSSVPVWPGAELCERVFAVLHTLPDLRQHVGSLRRRVLEFDAGRELVLVLFHEQQDECDRVAIPEGAGVGKKIRLMSLRFAL